MLLCSDSRVGSIAILHRYTAKVLRRGRDARANMRFRQAPPIRSDTNRRNPRLTATLTGASMGEIGLF